MSEARGPFASSAGADLTLASALRMLPLRLLPGQDVRETLEAALAPHGAAAAFVVAGIGSLSSAQLRLAGAPRPNALQGDMEILTIAGTLSLDGAHLHMSVADAQGAVTGGHVARGCIVRTTAEILLALLPGHRFSREPDAGSGFDELVIRAARLE